MDTSNAQHAPCVNGKPASCAGDVTPPAPVPPIPPETPPTVPGDTVPSAPPGAPPYYDQTLVPDPTQGTPPASVSTPSISPPETAGVDLPIPPVTSYGVPGPVSLTTRPTAQPGHHFTAHGQVAAVQQLPAEPLPPSPPPAGARRQEMCGPDLAELLADWPRGPQNAAAATCAQYGAPDDACRDFLSWSRRGPWEGIIVYREEIPHDWPTPHMDFLEQFIRYPIDPSKYDDIIRFDGSVILERTRGILGARCDNEAMNFLAVNLAQEIAAGKTNWEEARFRYEEAAKAWKEGQNPVLTQGLQFKRVPQYAGNRDVAVF